MKELLSPAGSIETFYAAIASGADAIYLGLDKFNARAYANNFNIDTLKELVKFAHLRNVKIYVTLNTIIYDDELKDIYKMIDELVSINIDAIIIQDLAVFNYLVNNYKQVEPHASTQMGVDDLDAACLLKDLGFKRIVFARETPINRIKDIKDKTNIEVEVFIHGALCVSYSGNCYMSSAIGERSGNRGRCAGCCRKYYSLIDLNINTKIKSGYLLSLKDLNTISKINDYSFIDSFKIEGRMKEDSYVASVTNIYRKTIDNKSNDINNLHKVFNRTYTLGFMNNEDSSSISNIERPNNYGYLIGNVIKQHKHTIWIRINKNEVVNKGDQLRIETNGKDEISIPVTRLFDNNFNELETCNTVATVSCSYPVHINAKVFKTKDIQYLKEIDNKLLNKKEYEKLPISFKFISFVNKPISLEVNYLDEYKVVVTSSIKTEEAKTNPTSKDNVIKQLSKLNDTPYCVKNIEIQLGNNCFIPLKIINELRREAINKLNDKRLEFKVIKAKPNSIKVKEFVPAATAKISVEVTNEEQYLIAKELGIETIYYKNVIRRNNIDKYPEINNLYVLVNGYNGIHHYNHSNNIIISDSSLNITNHISAGILSSIGVDRITLSQEISKDRIKALIHNYYREFNTYPNLELIVYGRSKIMHSKYCPLKRLSMCGNCKKSSFGLYDEFATFPILFNNDCTINLLNSKALNIMDEIYDLDNISYFRLVFTTENKDEVRDIINKFKAKLFNKDSSKLFDSRIHTRGHFFTDPL